MSIYDTKPIDPTQPIPASEVQVEPDVFEKDENIAKISNFKEFQAGAGSNVVKINKEGLFAGATNFTAAPFSVNFNGSMNATTGTFSGALSGATGTFSGTITSGGTTGSRIILDGSSGTALFSYNNVQYGTIRVDSSTNMIYTSNANHQFFDTSSNQVAVLNSSGLDLMDNAYLKFRNGSKLTDTGSYAKFDRTLGVAGDVFLDAGNKFQIGTTVGVTFSSGNVGGLFEMNAVGGIITYWNKF